MEHTGEIRCVCGHACTRAYSSRYATGNMKARVTRLLLHPRSSELDPLFVSREVTCFSRAYDVTSPSLFPLVGTLAGPHLRREQPLELYLRPTGTSRNIPAAGFNRVKFVFRRRRSDPTIPHGRGTDNESLLFARDLSSLLVYTAIIAVL